MSSLDCAEGDTKIVANFDMMFAALSKSGLIGQMTLPCHRVGVHPQNRGGKSMSGKTMQAEGAKIVAVGVSAKLCGPDRAVCIEQSQDREVYRRMVETSKGCDLFAVPSDNISFGSVGCSHLSQFLLAVKESRPTSEASLTDGQGGAKIDTAKLFAKDPELKRLCETGLTWSVISSKVPAVFPQVPHLFQQALNTEHHVAEGENWDQQLLQISKLASQSAKDSKAASGTASAIVDWDKVARVIKASQPPFIAEVPSHIKFLRKYGGGIQQAVAAELIEYLNLRMPAGRWVPGSMFDELARVPMSQDFQVPRLCCAVVKANASCDIIYVTDSIGKLVRRAVRLRQGLLKGALILRPSVLMLSVPKVELFDLSELVHKTRARIQGHLFGEP